MSDHSLSMDGVSVPRFLYGTAWKEDATQRLAELALAQGFRGIDTANQRRHYYEAAIGEAVAASAARIPRASLFLQTKFTFQRGQDHRLPYDPQAPIADQVQQSFASSLEHLRTDTIDSYLLHGPSRSAGLTEDDWSAWRSMENLQRSGRARLIGVSNFGLDQLKSLCRDARVLPRFVQNRCYAERRWDRDIRDFCSSKGITYQGFSLLTANRGALTSSILKRIAQNHGRTPAQIVFRFALEIAMLPLTGTTDPAHMQADLAVLDFQLKPEEIQQIENVSSP